MKLLLVITVALVGSAIADNQVWTEEMVKELSAKFAGSSVTPIPELIENNGYPAETHNVVTEDGYILGVYRIPYSPVSPPSDKKKPVAFLMHGLLSSSIDWVIAGPEKGLGYLLADAGYDVWMGNARGNTWSKNHTTSMSNRRYWKFSWHEIGVYDLTAMIDYALAATGQKQVVYFGHSQGTTSFFVMASQRPEYNSKIAAMFALAPIAYMGNLASPILRAASLGTTPLEQIMSMVGMHEFLPSSTLISALGARYCDDDSFSQVLCSNFIFLMVGFNKGQLNATLLPEILKYTPAGASTRQLVHYGQEIRSEKFRQYDHGLVENKRIYGQWKPPKYDLSLITAPVHLVYSDNDWMASVKDVNRLYNELGNPAEMFHVPDPKWNHIDFVWGIDAKKYIYDPILATLAERYST